MTTSREFSELAEAVEAASQSSSTIVAAYSKCALLGQWCHANRALIAQSLAASEAQPSPIPMYLTCPKCNARHIDEGEFATKPHHTHSCQSCGLTWRPAVGPTVGVAFLPGFKNELCEAQPASAQDGGWVLVPREPTEAMLKRADRVTDLVDGATFNDADATPEQKTSARLGEIRLAYQEMIAAAPSPAAVELWQQNLRALWDALGAIREFVSDHAAPGSVTGEEYLPNPEPMTEAKAIIEGIATLLRPTPSTAEAYRAGVNKKDA